MLELIDIEPDVAAIRDSWKAQIDAGTKGGVGLATGSWGDALGGLATGLTSGLTTMGSWQRVGDYVVANCGESAGTA